MGVYGKASNGTEISFPQTPSLVAQAKALAVARAFKKNINYAVVVPEHWELFFRKNQVMLELPDFATNQYRRIYGFVGGCVEDVKSRGPDLGLMFNVVLKMPFFFSKGSGPAEDSGEFHCSHVWVRVLAFSNLFCGKEQYTPFRAGEPVVGIIESTTPKKGEKHPSAMLVGWDFVSYSE